MMHCVLVYWINDRQHLMKRLQLFVKWKRIVNQLQQHQSGLSSEDDFDSNGRKRVRWANSAAASMKGGKADTLMHSNRIQELEVELAQQHNEVNKLRQVDLI